MSPVAVNVPGDCAADLETEHTRDRTKALVISKFVIPRTPMVLGSMVTSQSVSVRYPVSDILRSDLRAVDVEPESRDTGGERTEWNLHGAAEY